MNPHTVTPRPANRLPRERVGWIAVALNVALVALGLLVASALVARLAEWLDRL